MAREGSDNPLFVAMFGAPIACVLLTEVSYQVSRILFGRMFSDAFGYLLLAVCVVGGMVIIARHRGWTPSTRVLASIVYAATMLLLLFPLMFFYLAGRGVISMASH